MKLLFFLLLGLPGLWVYALAKPPARALTAETSTLAKAQLERGSDLFYRRCSVCHGKTGLGFEEARGAFPESHQRCTQCHKSGGPEVMVIPFQDNHMFDVGEPPALRGPGTLQAFSEPVALRSYIQAAMPRHAPGSLGKGEAAALAAFILELRATSP